MASYLETAAEIAQQAGTILARLYERRIGFELKGDFDLVTAADRESERHIVECLRTRYPSHSIVAEEGGGYEGKSDFRWYVDPLDGTTNFAHGFPAFNVTLGLEQAGEMIAGVVFDPLRGEMFAAERGGGAFLNNKRMQVSACKQLSESLVATGFPSRRRHENVNVHYYHQLAMATHGVRRAGAAALDLAYVACGRLEAFWEYGLKPWDMAAGILLVREAGGHCSGMAGEAVSLTGPHLLADNGHIHGEMVQIFSEIAARQYRVPLPQL